MWIEAAEILVWMKNDCISLRNEDVTKKPKMGGAVT
jgi:hypothetical protein